MELTVRFEGDDHSTTLTAHNTTIYRFRTKDQVDHLYFKDGNRSFFVFGNDDLMELVEAQGGTVVTMQEPTESDLETYLTWQDSKLTRELNEL